jgi:hypothetical protein
LLCNVAQGYAGKTLKLVQVLYKSFMSNTPGQKRLREAKSLSKRELKLGQREGAVETKERDLEERERRVEELSRVAHAMARLGFDPGPMPSWVAENISRAFGGTSGRHKNSQS